MRVSITLNGKEYKKDKATVGDWFDYLKFSSANKEKNLLVDEEAALSAMGFVAKYVGAPVEEILEHGDMEDIMTAYQGAQKAIISAHSTAAAAIWGKNAEAQE